MLTIERLILRCNRYFRCVYNHHSQKIGCLSIYHSETLIDNCHKCFSTLYKCRKETNKHMNKINLDFNIFKRSYMLTNMCCHNIEEKLPNTIESNGMDEDELKEELYFQRQNEYKNYRQQQRKILNYLNSGEIDNAVKTLLSCKSEANRFVYNAVLRMLSNLGEMNLCFKIYNNMRKIGIKPNDATYTCLINACAECPESAQARKKLQFLRQIFYKNKICLNETHYNAMIKAFGSHKMVTQAFELVDEMCEHHLRVGEQTYKALLRVASQNRENGLKLALGIWHLMKYSKIKPDAQHYLHLLKAARDTNFGPSNDLLQKNNELPKITYSDSEPPNLLSSPPVISGLLLPIIRDAKEKKVHIETEIKTATAAISTTSDFICNNLDIVHKHNRLILFGGINGILESMQNDGVKPNITLLTLLVDLIPLTSIEERQLNEYMHKEGIKPDTAFFNACIWKHVCKHQPNQAFGILSQMQSMNVLPNLHTFETLAYTCSNISAAEKFLDELSGLGIASNTSILSVLLKQAIRGVDADYIIHLLRRMKQMKIRPNEMMITEIKKFVKQLRYNDVNVELGSHKKNKLTYKKRKQVLETLEKFFSERQDILDFKKGNESAK